MVLKQKKLTSLFVVVTILCTMLSAIPVNAAANSEFDDFAAKTSLSANNSATTGSTWGYATLVNGEVDKTVALGDTYGYDYQEENGNPYLHIFKSNGYDGGVLTIGRQFDSSLANNLAYTRLSFRAKLNKGTVGISLGGKNSADLTTNSADVYISAASVSATTTSGSSATTEVSASFAADKWHNIDLFINRNNPKWMRLYINGAYVTTAYTKTANKDMKRLIISVPKTADDVDFCIDDIACTPAQVNTSGAWQQLEDFNTADSLNVTIAKDDQTNGWSWYGVGGSSDTPNAQTHGYAVTNDDTENKSNHLKIWRTDSYDNTVAMMLDSKSYLGADTYARVSFMGKLNDGEVFIGLGNASTGIINNGACISVDEKGVIKATQTTSDVGVEKISGKSFTKGVWHRFDFIVDRSAKTMDFYLDNEFVYTVKDRNSVKLTKFIVAMCKSSQFKSAIDFRIDNIEITKYNAAGNKMTLTSSKDYTALDGKTIYITDDTALSAIDSTLTLADANTGFRAVDAAGNYTNTVADGTKIQVWSYDAVHNDYTVVKKDAITEVAFTADSETIESLPAKKEVMATVKLSSAKNTSNIVTAAIYDAEGKMLDVKTETLAYSAEASATSSLLKITTPESVTNHTMRIFIFDSFGKLIPLDIYTQSDLTING